MHTIRVVFESTLTRCLQLDGLVLFPFVFISSSIVDTLPSTLKHEVTHVHQIAREGLCNFYWNYCTDLCKNSYTHNKYEQEAYSAESVALTREELQMLGLPPTFPKTDRSFRKQRKQLGVLNSTKTVSVMRSVLSIHCSLQNACMRSPHLTPRHVTSRHAQHTYTRILKKSLFLPTLHVVCIFALLALLVTKAQGGIQLTEEVWGHWETLPLPEQLTYLLDDSELLGLKDEHDLLGGGTLDEMLAAHNEFQHPSVTTAFFQACDRDNDQHLTFQELCICRGEFDRFGAPNDLSEWAARADAVLEDFEDSMNRVRNQRFREEGEEEGEGGGGGGGKRGDSVDDSVSGDNSDNGDIDEGGGGAERGRATASAAAGNIRWLLGEL